MARGEGGAGWSAVVLGRQRDVLDALEGVGPKVPYDPRLAWGLEGARESSSNHESNAWTAEAARAAHSGSLEQQRRACDVLTRAYFPRELGALWAGETMAPDNHGHQILAGSTMARVAAVVSDDDELLRLSGKLLCNTVSALKSVATPDLQVWSAGLRPVRDRATGEYCRPLAAMATAWLRMVVEGDPRLPALRGRKAEQAWRDPGMVCLRALRYLRQRGDDLGGAAEAPIGPVPLKWPLVVYRGDAAHLVVMPRAAGLPAAGVCDWCLVPYLGRVRKLEQRTAEAVTAGFDWQTPLPTLPRGSYTIRFPGRAA